MNPMDSIYTIDCESCEGKYVGEIKRLLRITKKEHRDEVEKVNMRTCLSLGGTEERVI